MMKFSQSFNTISTLVPLIDFKIPAGLPSPFIDYVDEKIDLAKQLAPNPISTYYCHCEGDSMIDSCIPSNSILVVDKSKEAKSGDIVVAYVNGGFTVKHIRFEENKCFLIPSNKKKRYPIIEVTEDLEMVIWGVVTNVVINAKNIRLCTL